MVDRAQQIIGTIEPTLNKMGYQLLGVEFISNPQQVLRIYIDHPAGITVDDCSKVSHQVNGLLDVEGIITDIHELEVSSPGFDRPLFKMQDYEQFIGSKVKVRLVVPMQGRRNFTGLIVSAVDNIVTLKVDQEEFALTFSHIERGRLVPEYD